MKFLSKYCVHGVLVLFWASAAHAAAPYDPFLKSNFTYFNRPGADLSALDADLGTCVDIIRSMPPIPGTPGVVGILPGLIDTANQNSFARINLENCMVFHGWRVVAIAKEEGAKLISLPREQLDDWVAQWVGATEPHGSIIRTFSNVVLKQPNSLTVVWPYPSSLSLSESRFNWQALAGPKIGAKSLPGAGVILKPLKPDQLVSPPSGKALLVVRVIRSAGQSGPEMSFVRAPAAGSETGFDKKSIEAIVARTSDKQGQAQTSIFSVSPGTWYIYDVTAANTCLSTPYFQISAGDVVFLGTFLLDDHLSLDLDPTPVGAALPGERQSQLRVATWKNGLQRACDGLYATAIQLPGLPSGTLQPSPTHPAQ